MGKTTNNVNLLAVCLPSEKETEETCRHRSQHPLDMVDFDVGDHFEAMRVFNVPVDEIKLAPILFEKGIADQALLTKSGELYFSKKGAQDCKYRIVGEQLDIPSNTLKVYLDETWTLSENKIFRMLPDAKSVIKVMYHFPKSCMDKRIVKGMLYTMASQVSEPAVSYVQAVEFAFPDGGKHSLDITKIHSESKKSSKFGGLVTGLTEIGKDLVKDPEASDALKELLEMGMDLVKNDEPNRMVLKSMEKHHVIDHVVELEGKAYGIRKEGPSEEHKVYRHICSDNFRNVEYLKEMPEMRAPLEKILAQPTAPQ